MTRRVESAAGQPLIRWGEELRRDRERRRKLRNRMCFAGLGLSLLVGTIILPPMPRLVWNASASAPTGLYAVTPGAIFPVGTMVVARPPKAARAFADARHYLPLHVPLVKRVAAGPGDEVCASGRGISIDGKPVALRRRFDHLCRPMPWWNGCRHLRDGQYFLLMANVAASFDGRYFGVSDRADIIGSAHPLWTR